MPLTAIRMVLFMMMMTMSIMIMNARKVQLVYSNYIFFF